MKTPLPPTESIDSVWFLSPCVVIGTIVISISLKLFIKKVFTKLACLNANLLDLVPILISFFHYSVRRYSVQFCFYLNQKHQIKSLGISFLLY